MRRWRYAITIVGVCFLTFPAEDQDLFDRGGGGRRLPRQARGSQDHSVLIYRDFRNGRRTERGRPGRQRTHDISSFDRRTSEKPHPTTNPREIQGRPPSSPRISQKEIDPTLRDHRINWVRPPDLKGLLTTRNFLERKPGGEYDSSNEDPVSCTEFNLSRNWLSSKEIPSFYSVGPSLINITELSPDITKSAQI